MKMFLSKILIILMLFSIGAELSAFSFKTGTVQYVLSDTDEPDKKEKEELEKDKIVTIYSVNFLPFTKEAIPHFFIPYTSDAFKMLPEIPPKQS